MQLPEQPKIAATKKTPYDLVASHWCEELGNWCCDYTQDSQFPSVKGCCCCACAAGIGGIYLSDAVHYFAGHAQSNVSALASAAGAIAGVTLGACIASKHALERKRERWKQYQSYLDEEHKKEATKRVELQKLQDTYPCIALGDDKKTN